MLNPNTEGHQSGLVDLTRAWFEPDGPLANKLPRYRMRPEQVQMAEAVAASIEQRNALVVEAGTGTGKSMAYLVPALLSGGKIIVSTGTKNLQDQLFGKDIPGLLQAAGYSRTVSLLKGRSNYLCFHRLRQAQDDPRIIRQRAKGGVSPWLAMRGLMEWGLASEDGDLSSADAPKLDVIPLARVTSTRENCLGTDCPDYSDCFVLKARRRAQEADIVVVNHHLLLADSVLREEGFAELLPDADAVILDEAHQLPQLAMQFFGKRFSYHQLSDIARDARAEMREIASDMPMLKDALNLYENACAGLLQALTGKPLRLSWKDQEAELETEDAIKNYSMALEALKSALEPARVRSKGLESLAVRTGEIDNFFTLLASEDSESIQWIDRSDRGFVLHISPIDVSEQFRKIMAATSACWIMTSATLSVDKGFDHFVEQMGAEEARTLRLESPFDYAKRSMLFLPGIDCAPNHPDYLRRVTSEILPVIRASGGGVFVLCTSLYAVSYFATALRKEFDQHILVQGDAGKDALIQAFRDDGNAILVATSSFWEGVDVQGRALRLVIIDKLPFAHPGDPVLKARLNAIQARNGSPFFDYQIPQAVISLKQGVGRLIRDEDDRGVVMICDPRIRSKGYGKLFLSSLPDMAHSNSLDDVRAFFKEENR